MNFNNQKINYLGVEVKVIRKETIYKMKSVMNWEKDKLDRERLAPIIDFVKLNKLNGLSKIRQTKILEIE